MRPAFRMITEIRSAALGAVCVCLLNTVATTGMAQQPYGSLNEADATVAGALEIAGGRVLLQGASTIRAKDHTAEIALTRGGTVKVCSTSTLHMVTGLSEGNPPFLLSIDSGAIEIATQATAKDMVMTPDLSFTVKSPGPLDLRMRMARNGDTCIENRGAAAPVVAVTNQFGDGNYELRAGQHVLFEHGSLKEVVDNEHEPCGCPPAPVVSVADAGVTGATATAAAPGSTVTTKTAAEQHPFPAAVSAGLAPTSGPPQAPAGAVHAQVSTTMSYRGEAGAANAGDGSSNGSSAAAPATSGSAASVSNTKTTSPASDSASASTAKAEAPPPAPAPPPGDVFHSIGRFFKRLFGGH